MSSIPEFQSLVRQLYAWMESMGSRGEVWMIDDLLTEDEMRMIVRASRQGYITVERVRTCGTRYIRVDLTEAGAQLVDWKPHRIAS